MNKLLRSCPCAARWLLCLVLAWAAAACSAKEGTVAVGLTGLDHLAAHLSIQNFWVNGTSGHQAGGGGSTVCCVSLPAKWRPGLTVHVKWAVTYWERRVYSYYERDVPVDRYDELGPLYVHFLRDGSVRVVSSMYAAWGRDGYYPGPSYDTVLKKQPWKDHRPPPGSPEFELVPNAMDLP